MTDILHQLHCTIRCDIETAASGCHCAAARDEITRLRAENERLREALEQLLACPAIADGNHNDPAWACHETAAAETFARKVLARASTGGTRERA